MLSVENTQILDRLIVGRVEPHIYAFETNTVPSFLKVGDTYRPVSTRLREWERHFPDLRQQFESPATINNRVYFRDYSVHSFLERDHHRQRLTPEQLREGVYYSREFFQHATPEDLRDAIADIHDDFNADTGRYDFYDASNQLPQTFHFERGEDWVLRPNQHEAVDNFLKATKAGRRNLLMYAVMRFGKSFTALSCAKAIKAKTVLIVSAKADVRVEWQKTVETAGNFKDWVFLNQVDLSRDEHAIDGVHQAGGTAAIFLTLQDLQGEELKAKHQQVFSEDIDLLIVDETHFGARAEEYGRVLKEAGQPIDPVAARRHDLDDRASLTEAEQKLKRLHPRIRLHLSGTPYRILMGSEFEAEDIISFVQFSDIVHAQEAWDEQHLDQDGIEEWDNPYFGFPQMIRFAFNPNESTRQRLTELRESGVSFAFSALLEPLSIKKDSVGLLHRKFKHESEILDLLRVIDGSKSDQNLLGFLDYDRIKQGQMCRHLVMVLPYCASCDAMEWLISNHQDEFKNLGDYKIINISGVEGGHQYKDPQDIRQIIKEAEDKNRKTLTLTVNRMLTGSTVEQWDTMLYLKDTASPQEYDQAIFRLQNQYIRTLTAADGRVIKENLKPQTLLVDFDPQRMFHMQEQKSLIYNVNADSSGNDKLEARLKEELRISPIITINHHKIHQVEAANILEAVSDYNRKRSITDEARDIPIDLGLLENPEIRQIIEVQAEIGSREGLTILPFTGEQDEIDFENNPESEPADPDDRGKGEAKKPPKANDPNLLSLRKKLQTYYQRILFYAMLTPTAERSLADIVATLKEGSNSRIARNLGLDYFTLAEMHRSFDPFKLSALDYKIQNISQLCEDETLTPIERATRALEKFTRISDSEVRTPSWLCRDMVAQIPGDKLKERIEKGEKILDIASKSGEFALALYDRLTKDLGISHAVVKDAIYSIPTSSTAYEFTRRFYEVLGINVDNIAQYFTSFDLLDVKSDNDELDLERINCLITQDKVFSTIRLDEEPKQGEDKVQFASVIGNPPYQESDGGAQQSARPIYHRFVEVADTTKSEYYSFVIPTRWYRGGKGLDMFRHSMLSNKHISSLTDFRDPDKVFPETNNRGGICYFLMDRDYSVKRAGGTSVSTISKDGLIHTSIRPLDTFNSGLFLRDSAAVAIVSKVTSKPGFEALSNYVSPRKPFGIDGNITESGNFYKEPQQLLQPLLCYGKRRIVGYVESKIVKNNLKWINSWKVFAPYANNIGTELNDDNQNAFVAEPGSVCSETFLVFGADLNLSRESAYRLVRYLKTKFARFLHAQAKISQHGTRQTYQFVPVPDLSDTSTIDWSQAFNLIDNQLFDFYGLAEEERSYVINSIKPME